MLADGGLLSGPLAPLGLILALLVLMIPLVFMFAFQFVVWVLWTLDFADKKYDPTSKHLMWWWLGGLAALWIMRNADFPSWFW